MSSMLHPVGPERRTTYWRRRLVVVLVLLALVVGITVLVRSLGSDAEAQPAGAGVIDPDGVSATVTPTGTGSPTASPTGSPSGSPASTSPTPSTPSTPGVCALTQLAITTTTDAPVYGPGANPQLRVLVQNTAAAVCEVRVGPGTRTLVLQDASGAQVWSSADCTPGTTATTVGLLAKGQREEKKSDTTVMTQKWNRDRSAAGCPTGLPAVEAGTYTLTGTWGDVALPPRASPSLPERPDPEPQT